MFIQSKKSQGSICYLPMFTYTENEDVNQAHVISQDFTIFIPVFQQNNHRQPARGGARAM